MEPRLSSYPPATARRLSANRRTLARLTTLFVVVLALPCFNLTAGVLYSESFDTDPGWLKGGGGADYGSMLVADGQAQLTFTRLEPTDPNDPGSWWASFAPWWAEGDPGNWRVTFRPGRTVELRTDVARISQEDVFAGLGVSGSGVNGYLVLLERNEITLFKFGFVGDDFHMAHFRWNQEVPLPETAATLSVAFTPLDDGTLLIHLRILDTTQQTVIWETKVTDTPAQDEVLPNRSVRGLLMKPESNPTPFTGVEFLPVVGICYLNTIDAPAGPVQVTLDNVQVLEYPAPAAGIERSVCVSWPEGTLEEQIVVGSSSLDTNAVWTPVAEPIFKRNGQLCVNVPLTSTEQYFQLVPGIQFVDDFSDPKEPFGTRNPYRFTWQELGEDVLVTNGVLRVSFERPVMPGMLIEPPGAQLQAGDFSVSVDIVDWAAGGTNWSTVGIGGRCVYLDPFGGDGFIGTLVLNYDGIHGQVGMSIWDGPAGEWGPPFNHEPGTRYRLQFSGVDSHLVLRVLNAGTLEVKGQMTIDRSRLTEGFVALWINAPDSLSDSQVILLDNLVMTGTTP